MTGLAIITVAELAMKLVEITQPLIAELARKGELTPEQEAEARARYEAHVANVDRFSGEEWKPDQPTPK